MMYSEDRHIFIVFAATIIGIWLFIAMGVWWGTGMENNRIYQKCLVENAEMSHSKVVEYCSERVK